MAGEPVLRVANLQADIAASNQRADSRVIMGLQDGASVLIDSDSIGRPWLGQVSTHLDMEADICCIWVPGYRNAKITCLNVRNDGTIGWDERV